MAIDWGATFGVRTQANPGAYAAPATSSGGDVFGKIGANLSGTTEGAATQIQATATKPLFDETMGALTAAAAPDRLSLLLGENANNRNIGYALQGQTVDRNLLQQQYGMNIADAQNAIDQNAVALGAAQRQPGVLGGLDAVQQQMFDLQRNIAGDQAGQQKRQAVSEGTAMGAMITSGQKQRYSDIYTNLVRQLTGIDLNKQTNDINYGENQAQAQDRIKTLQLEANNLGMKPDALRSMLSSQLDKLGLSTTKSVDDLLDGIAQGKLDDMKIYYGILQTAQNYIGSL